MKLRKNKQKSQDTKEKRTLSIKDSIKKINKKYLKNGSYSMLISVIFIVIIVIVNLIVGEIPSKFTQIDITDEKIYSIGNETKSFIKDLNNDVYIYQVTEKGAEDETISNLLQKYADESDHITVVQRDPVVNPQFTAQYTSDNVSSNSLIVVCGDRSKVVDYNNMYESGIDYNTYSYQTTGFDGEGQITSAIAYVTSEDLPVLYTLEGHGELELDSSVQDDIEKANIEIKSLNLLTEESVPKDADCLLINAPTSDISEDEKDAILEYLENGGKAMILSDYTDKAMDNFDGILENYGVSRTEGLVFEGDASHYAMQTPYYLVPTINSSEASSDTAASGYYVLAPYAQGIKESEELRDTVTIESILSTSDSAYAKVDLTSDTFEKTSDDEEGPFDLGVSITESVGDDETTQIVYYSTSYLLDSQANQMVSGGNEKLIMESLGWMCSSDETNTISIPSKSLEISYLTLTAYDVSFWQICTIGLIPGFFLVAGFVVWFKRRKA